MQPNNCKYYCRIDFFFEHVLQAVVVQKQANMKNLLQAVWIA